MLTAVWSLRTLRKKAAVDKRSNNNWPNGPAGSHSATFSTHPTPVAHAAPPHPVQVEVTRDEDDEPEVELTGDAGAPVNVSRVPVIVSVSQVGGRVALGAAAQSQSPAAHQRNIGSATATQGDAC